MRLIRERPDEVRAALARRGDPEALAALDEVLALDRQRRHHQHRADDLRAQLNAASKAVGSLRNRVAHAILTTEDILAVPDAARLLDERIGRPADSFRGTPVTEVIGLLQRALRPVSEAVEEAARATDEAEAHLNDRLLYLPNLPDPSVPEGRGPEENRVVRSWGEPRAFDFPPKAHWDLGPALGILDLERGVRMAGSRFYVLLRQGAALQRALVQWMLDVHVREHGYTEVYPPFLITEEGMRASGQLPKFRDNLYRDAEEDLWLIPTAEVPLTNMHRGEILEAAQLPIKYVAYTPCFRREKVAAGRDVRGIKRVHQFDKVEMYKFVEPERSPEELESLVADAEDLLQRLGLPYRVVELCAGDLGITAAVTYDIELWAPGCGEWLEVSSCSACGDFQARRASIRYRPAVEGKGPTLSLSKGRPAPPRYLHTLNGSGLALPRLMIALLETYQQPDGSVVVPEPLRSYTGFEGIAP